jgi:hypothetical protein
MKIKLRDWTSEMGRRAGLIGIAVLAGAIMAGCRQKAPTQTRTNASGPMPGAAMAGEGSLVFPNDLPGSRPRSIAFVCDASPPMAWKFNRLRRALIGAISALEPDQQFSVTILRDSEPAALSPTLLPATAENKTRASIFLLGVTATSTANPIAGLDLVLRQHPAVIYLIADSDYADSEGVLNEIDKLDPNHAIRIDTVAYAGGDDHNAKFYNVLPEIAQQSGGVYARVDLADDGQDNLVAEGRLPPWPSPDEQPHYLAPSPNDAAFR